MKKNLLALLALVLVIAGCPTGPVDVGVPDAQFVVDASPDAAPHRLGSFNPTCTGSGVPIVASGVQASACQTLSPGIATWLGSPSGANLNAAMLSVIPIGAGGTGTGALGTANGVVTSSGTALQQASGVLAGANFISIGTSPPASGSWRMGGGAAVVNQIAYNDGAADYVIFSTNAGTSRMTLGHATGQNLTIQGPHVEIDTTVDYSLYVGATQALRATSTAVSSALPVVGNASPYSVHGKTTVATAPPFTLAAADYANDAIMLSNAGAGTVTFPAPGSDAGAYYKTVINTGAGSKTLTDGGVSQPSLATNLIGRFLFDTAGVHLTGPTTAYP